MIHDERVRVLRGGQPNSGKYVLYWMQASVRAHDNHALEYALDRARELRRPLLVYFGLTANYPDANLRSFVFLLQGLQDTQAQLRERGLDLLVLPETAPEGALKLAGSASMVVTDRAYLRHTRGWRAWLAQRAGVPVIQVESDAVIPVNAASGKAEWAARTLRPKVQRLLDRYLVPVEARDAPFGSPELPGGLDLTDPLAVARSLRTDETVPPVDLPGGSAAAHERLRDFLTRLERYEQHRNDPNARATSGLSAYLHYGHISPLRIALDVRAAGGPPAFLEELIVRRELALNHCEFNPNHDRYEGLPDWARRTLAAHAGDRREHTYTMQDFEAASTHDPYWNAAMREGLQTGLIAGYMRMYWGKKVLEWSETPETAHRTLLTLNNRWLLDGRDPNTYANVGWIFGLHDRPWGERPVYGTVRSMVASGLKRKFDADAYARQWK